MDIVVYWYARSARLQTYLLLCLASLKFYLPRDVVLCLDVPQDVFNYLREHKDFLFPGVELARPEDLLLTHELARLNRIPRFLDRAAFFLSVCREICWDPGLILLKPIDVNNLWETFGRQTGIPVVKSLNTTADERRSVFRYALVAYFTVSHWRKGALNRLRPLVDKSNWRKVFFSDMNISETDADVLYVWTAQLHKERFFCTPNLVKLHPRSPFAQAAALFAQQSKVCKELL